ncbi:MAG: IS3 family transposase [bacterium]|nr:IS3 family transposase [bacterium]
MIRFVDTHRGRRSLDGLLWGVEPICEAFQFAPQTYYAAKNRPLSDRELRDELLKPEILRVFEENYRVYGAPKIWRQLNREGTCVARCTIERLMPVLGIRGVTRGRNSKTTDSSSSEVERPGDLLDRDFNAKAPNTKWVADFTYVRTRAGMKYAFIIDCYARMIVGWWAASTMRTDLVLDALEQAAWARGLGDGARPIHHSDAGSQYLSIAYTERLAEIGIEPSVGSIGDSYDNALAETIIGLYKTELVYNLGPFDGLDDLELATFEYVDWFNHRRLMGTTTPAEKEEAYHQQQAETPKQRTLH